ncbi:cell division control protein 48 homolog C-like isoform X3 [Salvia hispanica]|uniref:cell division control protein 48 homolog C-like isoform X3 n=1 Tax=Salvia hispanica TaxID=49212 RepID=UPI0020092A5B|nr:cell division control protein 48 homolog C-like isoform X3 [Salvia hispanica]
MHRETPLSGIESSMDGESGSIAGTLRACHDQIQRCHVETATAASAGAKNPSDAQNVQLSVDEPAAKRQKHDESQNANRQIEEARASASSSHSDSNVRELDSARNHKSGGDVREEDANGGIMAIVGNLGRGNKLGDSKRGVKKNDSKWPMFSDMGGLHMDMLRDLNREVVAPMLQSEILRKFGSTAILLQGPRGCGKTMLARAIGNEARVPFYETSAAALKAGVSGILELFSRAYKSAPSIVFIDEIDALTSETDSLLQCPEANGMVCPSAEMEEFSKASCTNWDDVGGLQLLKLEFERRVVKRIKFPRVYESLVEIGMKDMPSSFFLYGPHGCGKTLIVQALAKEAGANFMHIKGTELLKFGSWSRMMVENIFKYAKLHPPCIVFFDELDVFSPGDFADKDLEEDGDVWKSEDYREVRNQVFDIKNESDVYVFASSSKIEIVDRIPLIKEDFGRVLYAPLPSPEERGEILKALALCKPIDAEVDLMALGKDDACHNFNGADLFTLVTVASAFAIERPSLSRGGCMTITDADFNEVLAKISPSLSAEELKKWALHAEKIDVVDGVSVMDWLC